MKALRRLWSRLFGAFQKRRREREMRDELETHIEMQTEDNLRAGMAPEEAQRAAVLKFGSVESAKESYRDQWGAPVLENIVWDLRHALRGLRKNPGFTAVAVLTLALGIGANTAIFSIADAVLFRPLPFTDPDRLYLMQMLDKRTGQEYTLIPYEYLRVLDEHHRGLGPVGTLERSSSSVLVPTAEGVEAISTREVSANYFQILGVRPVQGRVFNSDDTAQRGRAAMLTFKAWRQRFGGDETIVGRSIKLGASTFDIVGVLPRELVFPSLFGGNPELVTVLGPAPPSGIRRNVPSDRPSGAWSFPRTSAIRDRGAHRSTGGAGSANSHLRAGPRRYPFHALSRGAGDHEISAGGGRIGSPDRVRQSGEYASGSHSASRARVWCPGSARRQPRAPDATGNLRVGNRGPCRSGIGCCHDVANVRRIAVAGSQNRLPQCSSWSGPTSCGIGFPAGSLRED